MESCAEEVKYFNLVNINETSGLKMWVLHSARNLTDWLMKGFKKKNLLNTHMGK